VLAAGSFVAGVVDVVSTRRMMQEYLARQKGQISAG
jgi:hypothetical protein